MRKKILLACRVGFTYLWANSFLRDKLVSVGPQIPVGPRPMAYYAYWKIAYVLISCLYIYVCVCVCVCVCIYIYIYIYIYHWRRKRGGGGGKGACAPPHFCLGGGQLYVCAPPTHTLFTPHFHFSLELYVYIKLTNNYLAFFIYQLIILWTISINWHRWLLVNNHISKYNSFILVLYRRYINYVSVCPPHFLALKILDIHTFSINYYLSCILHFRYY